MVIHADRDKDIWSSPKVDPGDVAEARRFAAPERKVGNRGRLRKFMCAARVTLQRNSNMST